MITATCRTVVLALILSLSFTACVSTPDNSISGIQLENMNTEIAPGENFMQFANGNWLSKTEIPADKSAYGAFSVLNDKAQEDVKRIIEDAAQQAGKPGSNAQKIGDFYASYVGLEQRNQLSISPLQAEHQRIGNIQNYRELTSYFARANIFGNSAPLQLYISPDNKQPDQYAVYIWQGDLGLPEREYYLAEDERSLQLREQYQAHIEEMFALAGWAEGKEAAATILTLETRLAALHMKKEDTRNREKLYNPQTPAQLKTLMPGFDWPVFLEAAGVNPQRTIVINQFDYNKAFNDVMLDISLKDWKTLLSWGLLNNNASYLSETIAEQNFNFYGTTLSGVKQQRPLWRRGVSVVNGNLGELVGKLYVEQHFPPQAKRRMEEMVDSLTATYAENIQALEWMGPETKIEALHKLSKFSAKIGYPNKWKDYSALTVDKQDLLGNINRSRHFNYEREIKRLSGPVDKEEWHATPQTVNAYYNPTVNQIIFPAAILQPPFFNLAADDAVNYGAIGAVIGHEIGHGFDDSGSRFDGDGRLRNWWTEKDREEFKQRGEKLIEQFNNYTVLDGVHLNGEFTLGENIGDLGGLSIAFKAWQRSLEGKPAPVIDGFTGEQRVFLGWAQVWATKYRDEALRQRIKTDSHAPAQFRVNGVVRNIPGFYQAFDIQPNDALYLPPEERVKIW